MKITVLMPVYEDLLLFKKAVTSVLAQIEVEVLLYISDDSRSSNIEKYIKRLNDNRIVYWRNEEQLGLAKNSNKLLKYVTTDWFKFQHQDDILYDDLALYRLLQESKENQNASFIFGKVEVHGFFGVSERSYSEIDTLLTYRFPIELLTKNHIGSVSNMIINKSMRHIKWNQDLKYFLDVDYYRRIYENPIFVNSFVNKSYHGGGFQIQTSQSFSRLLKVNEAIYILRNEIKHVDKSLSVKVFRWLFPLSPVLAFRFYRQNGLKMFGIKDIIQIILNFLRYYIAKKEII